MKYSQELTINLPRDKVIALFDNADNLKKWQPELVSFENIAGEPGEVGAQSRMLYKMGKREIEMVETITKKKFPEEFAGTYEAKGVWNSVENYFTEAGETATHWKVETEFKFTGFMKLIAFLMPWAFKKETCKFMDRFKEFCESQGAAVAE